MIQCNLNFILYKIYLAKVLGAFKVAPMGKRGIMVSLLVPIMRCMTITISIIVNSF